MKGFDYESLKKATQTEAGKALVERLMATYESEFAGKPAPKGKYYDFKRIYIDGDRDAWQIPWNARFRKLGILSVLALVDENYMEELEQSLCDTCDQFTWAWPAHSYDKDQKFDYGCIDLWSAQTGAVLSDIVKVYGDRLSVDIRDRILYSVKQKIIDNYENGSFWWEEDVNNWVGVCAGSVGTTYLQLFPERFELVKDRLISTLDRYLMGIKDDGSSTEGVSYLDYGMAYFCLFYDTYCEVMGERPEILNSPKLQKAVQFMNDSAFEKGLYIPFADGWRPGMQRHSAYVYIIKSVLPDYELPKSVETNTSYLAMRILCGMNEFGIGDTQTKKLGAHYYEDSEWLVSKRERYNFVAKCGNNSEMHNHCDVGAFEVNSDGVKIISDPGSPVYTWQYFNDYSENGRYGKGIFLASALAHSVPIVNGKPQFGYRSYVEKEPYSGKVISHSDDSFVMDIAGVYEDGEIDLLIVDYKLNDDGVVVKYVADSVRKSIAFRFVTEVEPKVVDGGVLLGKSKLTSKSGITPVIDKPEYQNMHTVLYTIDFEVNASGKITEEFELVVG